MPLAEKLLETKGVALRVVRLETKEQAQNAPCPFTTYSLFCQGRLLTHEILSEKRWDKLRMELESEV